MDDPRLVSVQNDLDSLTQQVADLSGWTVFSELQQIPLYPADKKIPFQLIQPGNVGNSGGGNPDHPHGAETITVQQDGSARIKVAPVTLPGGASDNFYNYMVLPFPQTQPLEFIWQAEEFNCLTATDWGVCQQLEFQNEIIENGFNYNFAWAISPTAGLKYFDKLHETWVQYLVNGKPVMIDLSKPTFFNSTAKRDIKAHTVTHETLQVGSTQYEIGITLAALPATGKQLSTSFQLDGNAKAQPYTAVLDGWQSKYR